MAGQETCMKRSLMLFAVLVVALPVVAQMHTGRAPGVRGTATDSMMSGITVGPDATVYVVRHASGSTSAFELAAVRPTGAVAWTASLDTTGAATIALNNTTVFVASFGTTGTFPNLSVKSQLQGFSAASGAKLFTVALDGVAIDLEPFTDGAYAVEMTVPTTMPGMGNGMNLLSRKLLSVSNSGTVNWTLALD
jgi:hypothetical protein